ncbi:flippase-like domain-containing protein [Halostella sp. JP-L12]|uniref:flippase-like domain-containing protein n=1 Tax=Halostella TaxID=1843185 RepID=UPI000EF7CE86|nr:MULTISPECIES: flippase-like domain-containing protein [Halostella]NHN46798.1 flippase-like domain-containing protein [Halostella sp. JP-L12]
MVDGSTRAKVVGFLGALAILAGLFWVAGVEDILAALGRARPDIVALVVVAALGWLLAWGLALRTVLGGLGIPLSVPRSFLVWTGAMFSNNVTPFGQAGGEPFTALLISRATDSEYETSLAAIASVDALNFVPSIGFALLGVAYMATEVTFSARLEYAAASVGALAVALPVVAYLGWEHRYRVERGAVRVVTPFVRWITKLIPRKSPPTAADLERRIEGFFGTIERVGSDRRTLAFALGFSALGWFAQMCALWLSLYALGFTVSFGAVMVAVPLGSVAGVTPLPGGLGGVEAVLAALLVPTTGIGLSTASAAVVIHRASTYWLSTVLGAGAASAFGAMGAR